jgi:hypothetical protein
VPGGIDNGKAGQKTLQVQSPVAFGGRLAPAMLRACAKINSDLFSAIWCNSKREESNVYRG